MIEEKRILLYALLAFFLLIIAYVDIQKKRIPNALTLCVLILGVLQPATQENFLCAFILGSFTGTLSYIYYAYKKINGLGMGDIKLFTVCGFWLTFAEIPFFIALTGMSGILWGLVWQHITHEKKFPFAPCIGLGVLTTLLLR